MREKIREASLGDALLRLFKEDGAYKGAVILGKTVKVVEGSEADDVWRRMHDEAGRLNPKYVGFDGARNRFLQFFPGGFRSAGYRTQERGYKVAAKAKLDSTAPLQQAASGTGFGEAVLSVFRAANLLYPVEKSRLQGILRGPDSDAFVQAAARFALSNDKAALAELNAILKQHDNAKWTVVTYLPFLWRPDQHMFLKPEVTKHFAARVGHRFSTDYTPHPEIVVYESLLDLATKLESELTDLGPHDRIDIQSFIWVVGDYQVGREIPAL